MRDVHRDVRCAGMRGRQRDVCERGALDVRWHVCDDHVREMHQIREGERFVREVHRDVCERGAPG